MRVLIAYAGRTGTTEKAAQLLANCFASASLRNLMEKDANPDRYDTVIVGSAIRDGRIEPVVRKWLIRYEENLRGKRKGIFLCNAFLEESRIIIRDNFPQELVADCVSVDSFGGELHTEQLNTFERMKLGRLLKRRERAGSSVVPCLLTDAIPVFAEKMREG